MSDAREFFDALSALGPLRVISVSGPSTFEAICTIGHVGIADGYLNAITPQYHWHLDLQRFCHLTSVDTTHARSGRRVLFFELREAVDLPPFLLIYLHREKNSEFEDARLERFARLHEQLAAGRPIDRNDVDAETKP